jgi:tetratricopeptide (TPR) repeat protein
MGLVDDAIQEFLKANELAEDQELVPQRILCCSMLTSSFNEVERSEDAVEWAYKGLDLPDIKDFEWKALKYDLASALEKQQEFDRALEEYEEILVRDSQYRDVDQRVEILRTQAV